MVFFSLGLTGPEPEPGMKHIRDILMEFCFSATREPLEFFGKSDFCNI